MPARPKVTWLTSPGTLSGLRPFRRIYFECPDCQQHLSTPESHATKRGRCPSCKRVVFTPNPADEKPAMMPGFTSPGEVPPPTFTPRPADEPNASAEPDIELAYPGLLSLPGNDQSVSGVEEDWTGLADEDASVTAQLRSPLPLELAAPWLGILSAIAALIFGLLPYLTKGDANPAGTSARPPEEELTDPTQSLKKLVTELSNEPISTEQLSLLRPVAQLEPKIARHQIHFREGHTFALRSDPVIDTTPAKNGARRVFVPGRTDGLRVRYLFEETTPGGWRLDWESAVGFCEMDWESFVNKSPAGPRLMRVVAITGDYFNDEFQQERGYLCVRLTDLHARTHCYGYAHRDSAAGRQLAPWIGSGSPATTTARVEFPPADPDRPNQKRNQVWIREIVSPSWFVE